MTNKDVDAVGDSVPPARQRPSGPLTTRRIPSRILLGNSDIIGKSVVQAIAEDDEELLLKLEETDDDTSDWLNEALDLRIGKGGGLGLEDDADNGGASRNGSVSQSNGGGGIHSLLAVDAQLAHLSTMLSVARQDTLASMDETIISVSTAVPRLGLELRLMHDTATTLKANIEHLRRQTDSSGLQHSATANTSDAAAAKQATAVLERLAALSALHGRMTAARDVLGLAESWSTLSLDVTAYLADAKFETAAARLSKAKSSLSVFERTPEYESHKKLLDGLGSTLETRMLPTLIDAIRDRDVEQCVKLSKVFRTIDRQVQYAQIWRRTRGEECETEWRHMGESADTSPDTLAGQLKKFAATFVTLLEQEGKIVGQIFPNSARESVESLASSVVDALQPSLESKLAAAIAPQQPNAIMQVEQAHDALRYASIGLADSIAAADTIDILESPGSSVMAKMSSTPYKVASASSEAKARGSIASATANTQTPTHTRRLSSRRISSAGLVRPAIDTLASDPMLATPTPMADKVSRWVKIMQIIPTAREWEKKLLQPLLKYQMDYKALERLHLLDSAQANFDAVAVTTASKQQAGKLSDALLGQDIANALRDSMTSTIELAKDAARRARALTYGLGCDGLVSCVDDVLSLLLTNNKRALNSRTTGALEAAQRHADEAATNGIAGMDERISSSSSIEGAEWKAFEEGMALLANLRSVSEQIEALELSMVDHFADLADFLLVTPMVHPATRHAETLQRICYGASGLCTASFRLLLEASEDQFRTGSLLNVLQRIRVIAALTPNNRARRALAPWQPFVLFQAADSALLDQVRLLQRHLTNMILSPLMPHLQAYANLSVWSASRLPGSVNEYDLTMPTFSLSPTEDMSRIGEALLDLPRLLEVWSELPHFRWGVQGLAFAPASVKEASAEEASLLDLDTELHGLFDPASQTSSPSPRREKRLSLHGSATATSPVMDRRSLSGTHHRSTPSVASIATLPARGEQTKRQEEQQQATSAAAAASEATEISAQSALQSYLTSISLTLISHLVSLVLPSIAQLSGPGASQLAADLEYLLTILAALNVSQQEDSQQATANDDIIVLIRTLEAWQDVCRIKDVDGKRLRHYVRTGQAARHASFGEPIAGFGGDDEKLRSLLGTQAFDMIARMRGW